MAGYLPEYFHTFVDELDEHPWLFASLGSMLVGLSGILPLLIIPLDSTASFENGPGADTLQILLSFAVGGLLGDVFLHLLPEAWEHDLANAKDGQHISLKSGLWCLCGMLVFIVVEKLFATTEEADEEKEEYDIMKHNGSIQQIEIEEIEKLLAIERKHRGLPKGEGICGSNGTVTAKQLYDSCVFNNNTKGEGLCCSAPAEGGGAARCGARGTRWVGRCLLREAREKAHQASKEKTDKKDVAGYLNLMANSIDNFTHGLAVGGSFLVGFRVGMLTTFAILVHEIPHEVGDFAILLKSGFSRWEAAKAQLVSF
ncbi:hypothetical protein O3G_MSEX013257 [Manduca sexta]|uniref:Zinc transporter ZIP13 n=1 Tax=Manduca sexta TaxID=7130 RepID=A0A921ZRS3_MANSE|nr:hypothetical protein O3G_MSEX013257 [Manduca sexta]